MKTSKIKLNYIIHKLGFSGFYALTFGIISAIAPLIMFYNAVGEDWVDIWIYTGSAGIITAFLLSKFFIERPQNYKDVRLIVIATLVGILSHWLFWYEFFLIGYINWKFFGMIIYGTPFNPINGIYGALKSSFVSLLFFGWTSIPISIITIIHISEKFKKSNILSPPPF